jgi:hypothetical protein
MIPFLRKYIVEVAELFCLLYLFTILSPRGTKDYTSLNFYLIIFQALGIVVINSFIFNKYLKPKNKPEPSNRIL